MARMLAGSVLCQLETGCRMQIQNLPRKNHISESTSGRFPQPPETGSQRPFIVTSGILVVENEE